MKTRKGDPASNSVTTEKLQIILIVAITKKYADASHNIKLPENHPQFFKMMMEQHC